MVNNKSIIKKWWFWAIVIFVVIGVIGSSGNEKDKTTAGNATQPTATNMVQPTATKKPVVTEAPKLDVATMQLTKENVTKVSTYIIPKEQFVKAEIETEKNGGCNLSVYFNPGIVWDEKDLVQQTADKAVLIMEQLFKNQKVNSIWFYSQTEMTDPKGNSETTDAVGVYLTKENAKDIKWDKFKTMVQADYKALFNIADSKFILPGISNKL